MPTDPSPNALVVRIFAREDGGFIESHPVTLDETAVRQLVPAFAKQPKEIHEIDLATAGKLAGAEIEAFSEEVDAFLEPAALVLGPAD